MLHETTAPTSIHPRATARHRFLRLAGLFPSRFLTRRLLLPSSCSHNTRFHLSSNQPFTLQHWLATPLIPPQHHSNPIASSFLQVAVSKAPTHSHVIHDSSQGRFRYSPRTSGPRRRESVHAHIFRVARDSRIILWKAKPRCTSGPNSSQLASSREGDFSPSENVDAINFRIADHSSSAQPPSDTLGVTWAAPPTSQNGGFCLLQKG